MKKTLDVTIDESTWPKPQDKSVFPIEFQPGTHPLNLSILELLLLIGYLTTPSQLFGTSMSVLWALVRYLDAVSDEPDLRITREFSQLDAHQKTIVSDDFGMGVPIYWLSEHLAIEPPVDGRYFINHLAASNGVSVVDRPKQGPRKAPDFVALDSSGKWHVMECKGTQSGNGYRKRQLGSAGPSATGGVAQKRSISFPSKYCGQRLACGLFLAAEGGNETSNLLVIDPPANDVFVIEENDLPVAVDTVRRAAASSVLGLAGFDLVSSAISSLVPTNFDSQDVYENDREGLRLNVVPKVQRAREQLSGRDAYQSLSEDGGKYLGQEFRIRLPDRNIIQQLGVRSLVLQYGVTTEFLDEISREIEKYRLERQKSIAPISDPNVYQFARDWDETPQWHQMLGRAALESGNAYAIMRIGSSFLGKIWLES